MSTITWSPELHNVARSLKKNNSLPVSSNRLTEEELQAVNSAFSKQDERKAAPAEIWS
jgi:hypothetical protein